MIIIDNVCVNAYINAYVIQIESGPLPRSGSHRRVRSVGPWRWERTPQGLGVTTNAVRHDGLCCRAAGRGENSGCPSLHASLEGTIAPSACSARTGTWPLSAAKHFDQGMPVEFRHLGRRMTLFPMHVVQFSPAARGWKDPGKKKGPRTMPGALKNLLRMCREKSGGGQHS